MSGRLALAQVLCPPYLPIKHAIETNEKMITTTYLEKDEKSQEDILKKHSPVSIEKYLKKRSSTLYWFKGIQFHNYFHLITSLNFWKVRVSIVYKQLKEYPI